MRLSYKKTNIVSKDNQIKFSQWIIKILFQTILIEVLEVSFISVILTTRQVSQVNELT